MNVEPVSRTPTVAVRPAVMRQTWEGMTFLHWRYEPDVVRRFLPPGIEPDLADGTAWVGLLPFLMRDVAVLGVQPPYLSTFPETNVRTYGVDRAGRRGIVFLSLDAARAVPVAVARAAYRLPYYWSSMSVRTIGGVVEYRCRRRLPRPGARSVVRVRPGEVITAPTPLEDFLSARWRLQVRWWRGTAIVPAEHPPWPLHRAEVLELDDGLVTAAGLPPPDGDPHVLYSPGVRVRIGIADPPP